MNQRFSENDSYTWIKNPIIAELAVQIVPLNLIKNPQYLGGNENWKSQWRACLQSEPRTLKVDYTVPAILESAGQNDWPIFVLQVGLWGNMIPGTMGKSHLKIYGVSYGDCPDQDRFTKILVGLNKAWQSLVTGRPLEEIWSQLRSDLDWSAVMISKCLHFMARSAGWRDPVPTPIDYSMVRRWLWPAFKNAVGSHAMEWPRPGGVNGDSWEPYNRYMSAIRSWAEVRQWSCMEIETALFSLWRTGSKQSPDFEISPR